MGEESPHTGQKFAHSPPFAPRKISQTSKLLLPPPPPPKQQFSSYNPIKTAFFAAVIALAPFLF